MYIFMCVYNDVYCIHFRILPSILSLDPVNLKWVRDITILRYWLDTSRKLCMSMFVGSNVYFLF